MSWVGPLSNSRIHSFMPQYREGNFVRYGNFFPSLSSLCLGLLHFHLLSNQAKIIMDISSSVHQSLLNEKSLKMFQLHHLYIYHYLFFLALGMWLHNFKILSWNYSSSTCIVTIPEELYGSGGPNYNFFTTKCYIDYIHSELSITATPEKDAKGLILDRELHS